MTTSEVKELEKQARAQKAEEMRAKGFVKVGSRWISQDEKERIESLKERIEEITESINQEAKDWAEGKLADYKREAERVSERSNYASQRYASAKLLLSQHFGDGCSNEIRAVSDIKRYKAELKQLAGELKTTRNKVGTAANTLKSKVSSWRRTLKNEGIRLMRRVEAGEKIDEATTEGKLRPRDLK